MLSSHRNVFPYKFKLSLTLRFKFHTTVTVRESNPNSAQYSTEISNIQHSPSHRSRYKFINFWRTGLYDCGKKAKFVRLKPKNHYTLFALKSKYAFQDKATTLCLLSCHDKLLRAEYYDAFELWRHAFILAEKLSREYDPSYLKKSKLKTKVTGSQWINPMVIKSMADLFQSDRQKFKKFWTVAQTNAITFELIPNFIYCFLKQNDVESARNFLYWAASRHRIQYCKVQGTKQIYLYGLNNGLNALLDYELATKVSFHIVYDTILRYNPAVHIYLFPRLCQRLHNLPRSIANHFFKLLLSRKANLHSRSFVPFIRNVTTLSDIGLRMVSNADRVLKTVTENYEIDEKHSQGDFLLDIASEKEPTNKKNNMSVVISEKELDNKNNKLLDATSERVPDHKNNKALDFTSEKELVHKKNKVLDVTSERELVTESSNMLDIIPERKLVNENNNLLDVASKREPVKENNSTLGFTSEKELPVQPNGSQVESVKQLALSHKDKHLTTRFPLFHIHAYQTIFRRLIKMNKISECEILLSDLLESGSPSADTKQTLINLILLRGSLDGIETVSQAIQHLSKPSKSTILILFKSLRHHKFFIQYRQIFRLLPKYNIPFDNEICTEYLRYISSQYSTLVLIEEYCKIFPCGQKLLQNLDWKNLNWEESVSCHITDTLPNFERLDYNLKCTELNQIAFLPALEVVYGKLFDGIQDVKEAWYIYTKYKQLLVDGHSECHLQNPYSFRGIESFITILTRKNMFESTMLAVVIFFDSCNLFRLFSPSTYRRSPTLYLEVLVGRLCQGTKDMHGTNKTDINLATKILDIVHKHNMPLSSKLVSFLIEYHLKKLNETEVIQLVKFAVSEDLSITTEKRITKYPLMKEILKRYNFDSKEIL